MASTTMTETESSQLPSKHIDIADADSLQSSLSDTDALPTSAALAKCAKVPIYAADGSSRPFDSLYANNVNAGRHLIIFIRHFFCGLCQDWLHAFNDALTPDALATSSIPVTVSIIGCGAPDLIPAYVERSECRFAIYADPSRKLYDHLGMTCNLGAGSVRPQWQTRSFAGIAVRSFLTAASSGLDFLRMGKISQLGGELLLEHGKPVWFHRMRNTRGHSEVDDIKAKLVS